MGPSSKTRRAGPAIAGSLLAAFAAAGCFDLDVANPNEPDLAAALSSPAEVEAHVAGAFHDWYVSQTDYLLMAPMLSGVSFQHSTWNICAAPYAEIPRAPVENELGRQCIESYRTWQRLYRSIARVADGLAVLDARPELRHEMGEAATSRILAFGRFVQGLAHGSLALLYDQGAILDETVDRIPTPGLVGYQELADAALGYLAEAAALAEGADWPAIPAEWASAEVPPDQLARLARSFAAQLRANVARTPAARELVDWSVVLADAAAGIDEDWLLGGAPEWTARSLRVVYTPAQPTQESYFILGMADQSGAYQRWLDMPLSQRRHNADPEDPILIVTADTRFPRGQTLDDQVAQPGSRFAIPTEEVAGRDTTGLWLRPDRGTWRWSYYRFVGAGDYASADDGFWPILTAAELRLLRAEARYRLGDPAAAAALVNESRTRHGLAPTDEAGTNDDCVPRLPDGSCGGLIEMLKWEKRLETGWTGPFLATWYFDGRGWGDLHAGTFLELPVPCTELVVLGMDCYTYGGAGDRASPGSGYAWPFEAPGAG